MANWQAALRTHPLAWLLEAGDPAVRHLALRQLLDRGVDEPDVAASRRAAMAAAPIAADLDRPGAGRLLGV
jgi:hypothetical protein